MLTSEELFHITFGRKFTIFQTFILNNGFQLCIPGIIDVNVDPVAWSNIITRRRYKSWNIMAIEGVSIGARKCSTMISVVVRNYKIHGNERHSSINNQSQYYNNLHIRPLMEAGIYL